MDLGCCTLFFLWELSNMQHSYLRHIYIPLHSEFIVSECAIILHHNKLCRTDNIGQSGCNLQTCFHFISHISHFLLLSFSHTPSDPIILMSFLPSCVSVLNSQGQLLTAIVCLCAVAVCYLLHFPYVCSY